MNRSAWNLATFLLTAAFAQAQGSFTHALSPGDFSAAGLDKLTPAELAKLDDLIGSQVRTAPAPTSVIAASPASMAVPPSASPALATAEKSAATAPTVAAASPVAAEKKAAPAADRSLLARAKVLLTPGTEIEYTTLDSTLTQPFKGWEKGTVFTLANGQRWQVIDDGKYWSSTRNEVKVRVEPGSLGGFFLAIDHGGRPKVKLTAGSLATP